jgi:hypothetical protein
MGPPVRSPSRSIARTASSVRPNRAAMARQGWASYLVTDLLLDPAGRSGIFDARPTPAGASHAASRRPSARVDPLSGRRPSRRGAGSHPGRPLVEGREALPRQAGKHQRGGGTLPRAEGRDGLPRWDITLEDGVDLHIHGGGKLPAARGDRVRITGVFTHKGDSFVRYRLAVALVEKLPASK